MHDSPRGTLLYEHDENNPLLRSLMTTAGVWAQTETTTQQAQKPITPYG